MGSERIARGGELGEEAKGVVAPGFSAAWPALIVTAGSTMLVANNAATSISFLSSCMLVTMILR